ncbi:MAG TPA: MSMEG_6728 family protein [Actinomycetales bacterium]|jgi:hypothetical protein
MQTFLPYRDFVRSSAVLDTPRLGKQRVETLQILRALELSEYGWSNHPVVRMWRGFTPAVVAYGLANVAEWRRRGYADSTEALIAEFAPERETQGQLAERGALPPWLGDGRLHLSHRSALVRKDPDTYRPVFGDVDDTVEYWWPGGVDASPRPVEGIPLWVVRAEHAAAHEVMLARAHVGLGAASGIDVDASAAAAAALAARPEPAEGEDPLPPSDLKALLAQCAPGRRPGKDLRQLRALLDEVSPGDLVGLLGPDERTLTVGTVTGDYRFAAPPEDDDGPAHLPHHHREVRWAGTLPRAAVRPPASLQDPRRLFAVVVDPHALPPLLVGAAEVS